MKRRRKAEGPQISGSNNGSGVTSRGGKLWTQNRLGGETRSPVLDMLSLRFLGSGVLEDGHGANRKSFKAGVMAEDQGAWAEGQRTL